MLLPFSNKIYADTEFNMKTLGGERLTYNVHIYVHGRAEHNKCLNEQRETKTLKMRKRQ